MSLNWIHDMLPEADAILNLEPEELAGYLLEYLNSPSVEGTSLNRHNFTLPNNFKDYGSDYQSSIAEAVMEAWIWLEREGMIVPQPGQQGSWCIITRRGQQMKNRQDLDAYRKGNLLPRQQLHPVIAQKVWNTFLRGDYDTAVFQAFKEVEVFVRIAGNFGPTDIGVDLMRKAFHSDNGPLSDSTQVEAERLALAHLFAGAIGSYKNPHSHRNVAIGAEEAVEMIVLASHLLRIVDARSNKS